MREESVQSDQGWFKDKSREICWLSYEDESR